MAKPRVLLLCGGQSEEHEVSLASARSVVAAAGDDFAISPLVIDKSGKLLGAEASRRTLEQGKSSRESTGTGLERLDPSAFDVVFPLLHGPLGEDGALQGMLKLMGLPFVGADVLGSAVGMDKAMMKAVFKAHDLPQVPYRLVRRADWQARRDEVLESLQSLTPPLFVKPANLGSSVGISKVAHLSGLGAALDEAAHFDRRLVVEQGIVGARELEVGVLGNDSPEASPVGEISYSSEFYDYRTKYTEGQARLAIPADIPRDIATRCRDLALQAFSAVDAAGLARVDFFYAEAQGALYLNEINTLPGFTVTSMYPKLWQAAGLSYSGLIERLIELALEKR